MSNKKFSSLIVSVLAGMLVVMPVAADDTEIYLGQNLGVSDVTPNILFVLDTSGSMRTNSITTAQSVYDPAVTYAGSYSTNRVYYSGNSYFDLSKLRCADAVTTLNTVGLYTGHRMAQWRSSGGSYRWRSINSSSRKVECEDDSGIDGDVGGDGKPYASNASSSSSAGWSNSAAASISWSGYNTYTLKSGNYKNWETDPANTVTRTRLEVVQDAMTTLINSLSNVNIGLMRYDSYANGGMVMSAMDYIDNVRTPFLAEVNAFYGNGGTPLAETMYEAALYYRGDNVDYGNNSYVSTASSTTLTKSVAASRTTGTIGGNTYKTPIEFQCQKNFVVYLTDGDPTSDDPGATRISNLGIGSCSGNCLDEITGKIASTDQSSAFAGDQVVSTYTIGFGSGMSASGLALLQAAALASKTASGAGEYYPASDTASLVTVFTNILTDILGVSSTFSSPAVSVNAFNRTTQRDDLYFSLFKPSTGTHWDGNFKRYRLDFTASGDPLIVDVNDDPAVNQLTGYFYTTSTSYWSPASDGDDAPSGGVASQLTNTRNVYTYTGSSNDLSAASNRLHETNAAVTDVMLGVAAAERDNLLKWARGIDVDDVNGDGSTTDGRLIMGDPLHSEPALVQYAGPDTDPDITAYVATNDGYLHAFNTQKAKGTEYFSFVPKELLPLLNTQYTDSNTMPKEYGLDGSITSWVSDDQDGVITPVNGDFAYLFFGMRRGGNHYYGMDVSDRDKPKLMWTIDGGTGDFAELGETWSQPVLRKIRLNNAVKYILIFGGGYDTAQDANSMRATDGIGRAIYIVDALTGQRLWWASSQAGADLQLTNMKYSIPSNVASADLDGDGYTDILYVGDMGGQIWRFDISKGNSVVPLSSLIKGGRIADLAKDGSVADNRRFYYPPTAALYKTDAGDYYITLAIASGYRAHPLDTSVEDRIYMIKDSPVKGSPGTYVTLAESDLFDTTDNLVREGTSTEQETARQSIKDAKGWYIRLATGGEKGLSKGIIFGGNIYITSYTPKSAAATGTCQPDEGNGAIYVLSLSDGGPADGTTKADRLTVLKKAGIPADPKMIRTSNTKQKDWTVCVGTECQRAESLGSHQSLYWFDR